MISKKNLQLVFQSASGPWLQQFFSNLALRVKSLPTLGVVPIRVLAVEVTSIETGWENIGIDVGVIWEGGCLYTLIILKPHTSTHTHSISESFGD